MKSVFRMESALLLQHADLGAALTKSAIDFDHLTVIRLLAAVIHRSPHRHRQRNVILHLLRTPMMPLQKIIHHLHLLLRTAGKIGNEKRNQILLLMNFTANLIEKFHELFQLTRLPFAHQIQNTRMKMLRRNFQMPRNMMPDDLLRELPLPERKIQAHSGIQKNFPDSGHRSSLPQKILKNTPVRNIIRTRFRPHAGDPMAFFTQ